MDEIADQAEERLHQLYWEACDSQKRAIDPQELTTHDWVVQLLAEAYDIALRVETDRGGWDEGRSKT